MAQSDVQEKAAGDGLTRGDELRTFLFLTVVLAPVVAVVIVGGFGFLVWMAQLLSGPPSG